MRPAFASTKQAAAFAVLLLVLLLAPVLVGKTFLPSREQAYATLGWNSGPYPWIYQQVFQETNDIDIVFMGSSRMLRGIDTPYVQAALSQKLGRPAVVRTIAWSWAGYDGLFFIAQDLLQHRKVRQLVFYDENSNSKSQRNPILVSLFRFGEDASSLSHLPLADKGIFYFAALIGMPRNLLGLARTNIPVALLADQPGYIEPTDKSDLNDVNAPSCLGAVATRLGYNSSRLFSEHAPFSPYRPAEANFTHATVYTAANPNKNFEFSGVPLPVWQFHFARQFGMLAEAHNCHLVMLHIPTLDPAFDPIQSTAIQERAFWPSIFSTNMALVGIPSNQLFQGLTDDKIKKLYFDPLHLNQNGMEFFTRLITPALLEQYEAKTNY